MYMSAGRQMFVGYSEFQDKKGFANDRIRYRNRDYKGGEIREMNRCRKQEKEITERGVVMRCEDRFTDRSDSGSSDGVGLWKRRVVDREPGELSGESGSEGGVVLDLQVEDNPIMAMGKKRKYLEVVQDRDDKEVSSMLKNRDSDCVLTPPFKVGLDVANGVSPRQSKIAKIEVPESTKYNVEFVDDEDFVPLRNIRSSRWANDVDSPACEGEITEGEVMPTTGEFKREGSSGVRSDSDEHVWSSSRDSCSGHVTDNTDMEEDEGHLYDCSRVNQSDTELEDAPKLSSTPRRNVNTLHGCRSVDEFERLNKINEGTYGIVYRARDKKTAEIVALKKVKMEKEREGFPLTALREINILLSFDHSSIVDVKEIVVGSSFDDIFMVMEYMEHDLKGFLETREQPFSESEVKSLMLQLLKGTKYLHDNWVLHRDLKTSNLLLNDQLELKICDFGLARQYGSPLKPYTQLVVTLWYRAPELLLGAKQYSTAIDMWSVGCIMAELLSKVPLFNGKSELDQIDKIFRTLGTPNDTIWAGYSKLPGAKGNFVKQKHNMLRKKFPPHSFTGAPVLSDAGFDLLSKLLTYDPERRISAEAALEHDWFQEVPCSKDKEHTNTSFDVSSQDRCMRRETKGPDTLEGQQWRELQRWGSSTGGVFG